MTCTDGIYINDRRIDDGDCSGPQSARCVLMNPASEMAVLETARGGILREGLAFDYCDVAVVTNIGEGDHLGLADVNTPEDLAKVKRCIVEAVAPSGFAVLNANDPLVVEMAAHCHGGVIFFALDANHPVVVRHRGVGGSAVFVRDGQIVLAEGDHEEVFMPVDRLPLTRGGQVSFQVENTLAAVAAAWALNISTDLIRTQAESIAADMDKVPGRFNVIEIEGATVVVDYGHNAHSLSAVLEALAKFPHEHRTVVYSTAGDRRDCDMIRQGELLGAAFDRVVLYEDHYLRGRAQGEIVGLFRKGVEAGARAKEIIEVHGAIKAAETALASVKPGELVLLQADAIDETMQWLRGYIAARTPADGIDETHPAGEPSAEAESLNTTEIGGDILSNSPTIAKV
jgi:cyanophycin synthetase